MDSQVLEAQVGVLLKRLSLRLAVAESCTGGLVGHRLTNVPGSSAYYLGSITAYAYEVKIHLLGVQQKTLELYGAVSKETVLEMATGVRKVMGADIGISISGVAGPDGGSPEKPVGLVWIGLSTDRTETAWKHLWQGDRLKIKEQSVQQALQNLVNYLDQIEKHRQAEFVDVTVRFNREGMIEPVDFTLREQRIRIDSTGRQWEDAVGRHILVMDLASQVYELVFTPSEGKWSVKSLENRSKTPVL